jgi:hypothetical protein
MADLNPLMVIIPIIFSLVLMRNPENEGSKFLLNTSSISGLIIISLFFLSLSLSPQ